MEKNMSESMLTATDKFYLSKKDLDKIQSILNNFTDVDFFEISQERGNGIGTILKMSFKTEVNRTQGIFTVEISGIESW